MSDFVAFSTFILLVVSLLEGLQLIDDRPWISDFKVITVVFAPLIGCASVNNKLIFG